VPLPSGDALFDPWLARFGQFSVGTPIVGREFDPPPPSPTLVYLYD